MARRPAPQPAATRPRIAKASEDHPATATTPEPAPAATTKTGTATAQPAKPQPVALVPFSTRIPQDLRERYEWLRFVTRSSVQELVIEALTAYADQHPRQPPTDLR